MKSILGFSVGEGPAAESVPAVPAEERRPVPALVTVRFLKDGRTLTYFNDAFALEPGDHVFVSGKLAGQLGIVEKITTRFKIRLADYERVISKAETELHGTYESVLDKMLSFDPEALSPEAFRSWILPPAHRDGDGSGEGDDGLLIGEGYELELSDIEHGDEVSPAVLARALDYCQNGKAAYICVRGGVGTAYVNGSSWYEVNFRLHGGSMTEMYCDCPCPGLCKHQLALALTLRALFESGSLAPDSDFVAIDRDWFWSMAAHKTKKITL